MAAPLADRLRPTRLEDVVGQKHLLGENKALRRIIESGEIPNLIFYGPSGVGKTTVAEIIASGCGKRLHRLNATTASISDIKDMIAELGSFAARDGILLYLDEIQYFNKKQQQTLLEYIEKGDITLIASTTENPYFYIYNAILSRSTVFEFKQVEAADILPAIRRGVEFLEKEKGFAIRLEEGVAEHIARAAGGDVRKAINALELCVLTADREEDALTVALERAEELSGKSAMRYDRQGDDHYDIVSAYQKSMRGSDPDAALHYLARLLTAGDLPSACRRLLVCAAEDVGLAYPQILPIVKAAVDAAMMVGLPEAQIPLADAVVLVATAPKSNSACIGIEQAMADVQAGKSGPIPRQLQNKHFDGEDQQKKGQFYIYPHDYPNHYYPQQYLPDALQGTVYYTFGANKNEQAFKAYWDKIKGQQQR
ncbi:MAG TPA: replication-associated recombination protein A [Firmicutes bacterium]|nr:replication-associated recombination protein A [Bacillota bacterium]